jgi:hypothetical protein
MKKHFERIFFHYKTRLKSLTHDRFAALEHLNNTFLVEVYHTFGKDAKFISKVGV